MSTKYVVGKEPYYITETMTQRVTHTPTKPGEYRIMRKLANSTECIDCETLFPPSVDFGIYITALPYSMGGLAETGGDVNKPNRWEIYVGPYKKNLEFRFYSTNEEGGVINTQMQFTLLAPTTLVPPTTPALIGLLCSYDEQTGVAIVDSAMQSPVIGFRQVGIKFNQDGAAPEYFSECCFDILVS